jgi:hypothetical protein
MVKKLGLIWTVESLSIMGCITHQLMPY